MKLCIKERFKALNAEYNESENSILEHTVTEKQSIRVMRKCNCKAVLELVRPLQGKSRYLNKHSKELRMLLEYYSDVFPEELSSLLSSKRKVELTTNLQGGEKNYRFEMSVTQ